MADATAVISLIGKDNGLSSILGKGSSALANFTGMADQGSDSILRYTAAAGDAADAITAIGGTAVDAGKSLLDLSSASTSAYNSIVSGSGRTIQVANVLDDGFTKLALSVAGFGEETSAVNSVLQPTAEFLSTVSEESTAVGKGFVILHAAAKPIEGVLTAAADAAGGLAEILGGLGPVGEIAAAALLSVGAAAASLAGMTKTSDAVGQLYGALEHIQEIAPEVVGEISDFGSAASGPLQLANSFLDTSTKLSILATGVEHFGSGTPKAIAKVYGAFDVLKQDIDTVVESVKILSDTTIALILHFNDFGKALDNVRNLGFDTYAIDMVSSLGLVGEGLLFNTKASKEFGDAAVAAFSKVQDSMAFITTLPAGQAAGIPKLSKQLDDLVNGPLQNMITKGEAAAAMYQSLSAGIGATTGKLQEAQPFMEAALKLSTGTETAAATTVETLAKVTYAYRLNVNDATTTAAKLNGVVQEGIVTFPELAGNIGRVAGIAAQAKVPFDELLGSVAALTKTMSADDAMTGYQSLLNSIAGSGAQAQKAAAELGVQFDIQAVKAKGLLNVLRDLYDKSGGNISKIKEIIPDSQAFATALTLMTSAFKEAKEKTDTISTKTGQDLEDLFGARNQSLVKQMTSLVNGFQEVLASYGEKFTDNLKPGMDFLRGMLENFQKMPEPLKVAVGAIVAFNASVEKTNVAIGIVVGAITQLVSIIVIARLSTLVLGGQFGLLTGAATQLFQAVRNGTGIAAALTNAFEVLTGATTAQELATKGLGAAEGVLGIVNRALTAEIFGLSAAQTRSVISSGALAEASGGLTLAQRNLLISTITQSSATKGLTFAEQAAAIAKIGLTIVTTGLSAAIGILASVVRALWVSFGPLAIVAAAITVAFKLLSEVFAVNIFGMKSAAAEAQDHAAQLRSLGAAAEDTSKKLGDQNKVVKDSIEGYEKRIAVLQKNIELAKDGTEKRRIEEQIRDLQRLEEQEKKINDKKYNTFGNTFIIPAAESLTKFAIAVAAAGQKAEGTYKGVENFFREMKERDQEYWDERNGIYQAMEENQKQVNKLYDDAIHSTEKLKQGSFATDESKQIIEATKERKINAEELEKITQSETKAYERSKDAIDSKVTALQDALKEEKNPERASAIKQQISDLNSVAGAYDKATKATLEYINKSNDIRDAIQGAQNPKVRIQSFINEQEALIQDLDKRIAAARNEEEKTFLKFQRDTASHNIQVSTEFQHGMLGLSEIQKNETIKSGDELGKLQRRQLVFLSNAYKNFSENALKTQQGASFKELTVMRDQADKLLDELEKNFDNISTKSAETLVTSILEQKVRLKESNLVGSILSPDQIAAALDTLEKAYQRSAQRQIDINTRKIDAINHLEAIGVERQTLADKQRTEEEIKNNNALLEARQKNLNYRVNSGNLTKESEEYKKLNEEILELQRKGIQMQYQLQEKGIEDRLFLNKRGLSKDEEITNLGIVTRIIAEKQGQDELYKIRQKANLEERKALVDRINLLKARGGDYNELEIQLLKLRTEYENNALDKQSKDNERYKSQLNNRVTESTQIYQKESDSLDTINKQLERNQKLSTSRENAAKTVAEIEESGLELQLRVTGDIQKKADIEAAIAQQRIKTLIISQKIDKDNLAIQNQLQLISINKEEIGNKIAKTENIRAIAALQIDMLQAKRQNKSLEELKAMQLQLAALREQGIMLDVTGKGISENRDIQKEVAKNTERELSARQKIALQGGLLDLQLAKINQAVAKYEKQKEFADLYAKELDLENTKLAAQADAVGKIYDLQNKALTAQKSVFEGRVNRVTSELEIASNLITSDMRRKTLAETIARIKYDALIKEQDIEKKILELNIEQNKLALEKEKSQTRVQLAQNKADVLGAFADAQKIAATPGASDAQKIAAQLNYQAKLEQGAALAFGASQIGERERIQNYSDDAQRKNLADQQSLARTQAEASIIGTLPAGRARRASRELSNRILGSDLGITATVEGDPGSYQRNREGWDNLRGANRSGRITAGELPDAPSVSTDADYDTFRKNYLAQSQEFLVPAIKIPQANMSQAQGIGEIGDKDGKGNKGKGGHTTIGDVKLTIQAINIELSTGNNTPQGAAKEVKQALLDQLYDITNKVTNKMSNQTT